MKVNRRDFLRSTAIATGSVAALSLLKRPTEVFAAATTNGRSNGMAALSDTTRCVGCRRCEAACNWVNRLQAPAIPFEDRSVFKDQRRTEPEAFTVVNRYESPDLVKPVYRKIQCMHCAEPACATACLVGALKKTPEGAVIYDENLCIGCRYCMTACPFYIPTFEYFDATSPAIRKCTMCYNRIHQGQKPACAEACPVDAITFGKRSDILNVARDRIRKEPQRYIDYVYGEHEAGGTDWLYISGVPFGQLGLPEDLGTTPFIEYTQGFLSVVPLVLIAWPAIFGGIYTWTKRNEQLADAAKPEKGDLKR